MWRFLRLLCILAVVSSSAIPRPCVPKNVTDAHNAIASLLNLKQPEFSANPLFNAVIHNLNASCQRQHNTLLMRKTLDVYIHIFSSMLKQGQAAEEAGSAPAGRQQAQAALRSLKDDMQQLQARLSSVTHACEDATSQLHQVQVNDSMHQRRALAQLKEVYMAASLLVRPGCRPVHHSV